ncbi:MAG: SHOCT domain-containing protein [bacterium]|nr:SHOCT domain-containing protein [bacterium]
MKPIKKLWNITPAVIIGKKIQQSGVLSHEKKVKTDKPIVIKGTYFSSHPQIHNQKWLKLEFSNNGIEIYGHDKKASAIRHFDWSEVVGYENEAQDKSQINTSQRLTATRMVTLGVFSLAAPKKNSHGAVKGKFYDILQTTTGTIELETEIDSGNMGGSIGDMSRSMTTLVIKKREVATQNIKRLVAEKASGKVIAASEDFAVQIAQLGALKNQGLITKEEFAAKKKQLLGL